MDRVFDKDYCLSSYMAFRYIWKDGYDFFPGFEHRNYRPLPEEDRIPVKSAGQIGAEIQRQIENLYRTCGTVGILLSGGMDSAILASYMRPGSHAYTFVSSTGVFDLDLQRAKDYSERFGLIHHQVDITFEDYKKLTPIVMARKWAPVHSIEPQIYKAAIQAKKDGVEAMIIGDGADYVFGGMDRLLSRDWGFEAFVQRYYSLDPERVLAHPVSMKEAFEPYRTGPDAIDFAGFLQGPCTIESYSSYENALEAAEMPYIDPYIPFTMAEPLDLKRIRGGEPKYLIRELFALRYPSLEIPAKIPMPRPVDTIFKDWSGPSRPEFRQDIDMDSLSGNQKWQLWCAELFLECFD